MIIQLKIGLLAYLIEPRRDLLGMAFHVLALGCLLDLLRQSLLALVLETWKRRLFDLCLG
jgi:hypothetical protein